MQTVATSDDDVAKFSALQGATKRLIVDSEQFGGFGERDAERIFCLVRHE